MKTLNFPLFKLLISLIIGILLGYYLNIALTTAFLLLLVFIVCIVVTIFVFKSANRVLGTTLILLLCFSAGILSQSINNPKNSENHYSKYITQQPNTLYLKIKKIEKPTIYHHKYLASVLKVNNTLTSGTVLLLAEKDSTLKNFSVDQEIVTINKLHTINSPLNPHQFNYKNYLAKQHIYHQLYAHPKSIFLLKNSKTTIFGLAHSFRENIIKSLQKNGFKKQELAIIKALLLGQREDISKETYNNYKNAGALHILAVSGLHIGVILLLLNYCFSFLLRFKNGRVLRLIIVVLLLWAFAFIAGLSASVIRAVTMFSFIAYAFYLKRQTNMYNVLALSMFFLLLGKPMLLFNVGFQLSYAAVFAIITIHPFLLKLWYPSNWFLKRFWDVMGVSIAAQIGVLPISLYYFHQFPGLFFLSNLMLVPFLGIILGFGIIIIFLGAINLLPAFLANTYLQIIKVMNNIVAWIGDKEDFVVKHIFFNEVLMFLLFLVLLMFFTWVSTKKWRYGILFFVSIILVQATYIYTNYYTSQENSIIVFHENKTSVIAQQIGQKLTVFANPENPNYNHNPIVNFTTAKNIKEVSFNNPKLAYFKDNKTILVIDSLGIYNLKNVKPNIVVLTFSPKIHLDRLIQKLQPELIIADGSNYKSFVKRWEETCIKQKLPFYYTGKKGAYIIR